MQISFKNETIKTGIAHKFRVIMTTMLLFQNGPIKPERVHFSYYSIKKSKTLLYMLALMESMTFVASIPSQYLLKNILGKYCLTK